MAVLTKTQQHNGPIGLLIPNRSSPAIGYGVVRTIIRCREF